MGVLSAAELTALLGAVARPADSESVVPVKSRRLVAPAARVKAESVNALARGAWIVPPDPSHPEMWQHIVWPIAGSCEAPKLIERFGEGHGIGMDVYRAGGNHPHGSGLARDRANWEPGRSLWLWARCRLCKPCLQVREELWSERAFDEYRTATRTWFCTMTFGPGERFRAISKCREYCTRHGEVFDDLSTDEQFRLLQRQTGPEVTRFLYRLRAGVIPGSDEATGKKRDRTYLRCRYLIVVEPHKDGFPHYHALIHEVSWLTPVKKLHLKKCWRAGFLDPVLVKDQKAVNYVAKYLSKYSIARVRASQHYGYEVAPTVLNHRF